MNFLPCKLKSVLFMILIGLTHSMSMHAQSPGDDVAMADLMHADGKIYVVISVLCAIFLGIIVYLLMIDRRLRKLENNED